MITPCGGPAAPARGVLLRAEEAAKPTIRAFDPMLDGA